MSKSAPFDFNLSSTALVKQYENLDNSNDIPKLLINGKEKSYQLCKLVAFEYMIEIISTSLFKPKNNDIIFMYLAYYDDYLLEEDFLIYMRYSLSGTFFSEIPNFRWLLDLFYCIITDNLYNFRYFLQENTDFTKETSSHNYFINSRERMNSAVKNYKISNEEKEIIGELKLYYNNFKIIVERYPIILIKILKYLIDYCSHSYKKIVSLCIEDFRYTEFYDKMMVGFYS